MRNFVFCTTITIALCSLTFAQDWPQWALNAQHTGDVNVQGQSLTQTLVNIVYDPLVPQEQYWSGGDLLAHFQAPLVDGNDVYMVFKSGKYRPTSYATQTWSERKLSWHGTQLLTQWSFTTDWVAPGSLHDFWEPVFHPALSGDSIYIPGAGGTIFQVRKSDGTVVRRLNPFGSVNPNTFTVSPITVDANGNLYYNVLRLSATGGDFYDSDAKDSWLVKVSALGTISKVSYLTLTPGAPGPKGQCLTSFSNAQLPWPPSPTAVPPSSTCGTQRVALNVAPAVAPDGTIYSATRSHFNRRYGYLVAVNTDLTRKWNATIRDRFNDGCRVVSTDAGIMPLNGEAGGCRIGSTVAVDPVTNRPGGGSILDDSSATPTVAPDGSVFFGVHTTYNYRQGQLMKFDHNGNYSGAYEFGWDTTPAIYPHNGTYSVVLKENHYGDVGSYCNGGGFYCPTDRTATNPSSPEAYFVTQLDPSLNVEWRFQNTNTLSCVRNPDNTVSCTSDHPNGFEWCVNAAVVDNNGTVYGNSEDGNLYAISQGGTLSGNIFQQLAIGAAYTPTSLGQDGKIYTQNAGHLFVAAGP